MSISASSEYIELECSGVRRRGDSDGQLLIKVTRSDHGI